MAADIDGDGFDEILPGACAIDHDGKFMWATGHGHGDANHVGDFDIDSPGLEIWLANEQGGNQPDHYMVRARDGRVLWGGGTGADNGRGMVGDIDARTPGQEAWSAIVPGVFSAKGVRIASSAPSSKNFRVYWDGDLQDELLNGSVIDKWNGNGASVAFRLTGGSNNGSKSTPNISADLIGDWREEIIMQEGSRLYLHTTVIPTEHKLYTLMHDPVYRNAISWQQSSYNQPPHLGFFLGAGVDKAPTPNIVIKGEKPCISGDCPIVTGITSSDNVELTVHPNPTQNKASWGEDKPWSLFNAQGQEINQGLGNHVDLSNYPNGVYMLKIENNVVKVMKE
jgi:rhamnogalacturonan endolyase